MGRDTGDEQMRRNVSPRLGEQADYHSVDSGGADESYHVDELRNDHWWFTTVELYGKSKNGKMNTLIQIKNPWFMGFS
jgi:hypothetical protein